MTESAFTVVYRPGMTIGEACMQASSLLAGLGIGEPRSNADLLLGHVLGYGKAQLLRDWHDPMPEQLFPAWAALIARKAAGEPVQYLIGEQWFYGRPFEVTPAVLIPRPETELLVEAVLAAADELWPGVGSDAAWSGGLGAGVQAPDQDGHEAEDDKSISEAWDSGAPVVVDVGTGSGAIAVTLASERAGWRVFASDLSPDALEVARRNAGRHVGADRIVFACGDLLAPFAADRAPDGAAGTDAASMGPPSDRSADACDAAAAGATDREPETHRAVTNMEAASDREAVVPGSAASATAAGERSAGLRIDVLVSNPPYIPAGDLPGLQTEVRDYEPRLALDGGEDGLDPYRRMAEQLRDLAQIPRIVGFELGMGQAQAVADLLRGIGYWDDIRIVTDYGGIDRHVVAVRSRH